ncbi:MAG: hypothetical protein R3Y43_06505 [Alphaproteobacteria bacterium]
MEFVIIILILILAIIVLSFFLWRNNRKHKKELNSKNIQLNTCVNFIKEKEKRRKSFHAEVKALLQETETSIEANDALDELYRHTF